jgi:hypothetical protein
MNKVIKDGKVAVLYSPGFGAGWHTWGAPVEAIFDPDLVQAVLAKDYSKAQEIAQTKWPNVYHGGVDQLEVEWVTEGALFQITEYDGAESVETQDDTTWIKA